MEERFSGGGAMVFRGWGRGLFRGRFSGGGAMVFRGWGRGLFRGRGEVKA